MEERSKNIEIPVFSIIMTIGPSGCGKTTFVQEELLPQLREDMLTKMPGTYENIGPAPNIQYISSDDVRRELLGDDELSKHDPKMGTVSASAFELLKKKVEMAVSYPVNAHYVVIDSTAISKNFREEIFEIAKENGYYVAGFLFNYNKKELLDLIEENEESPNELDGHDYVGAAKKVAARQHRNLTEFELKEIKNKDYDPLVRFRHLDEEAHISTKGFDELCNMYLYKDTSNYLIIGDVHGCYDELIELLEKNGGVIENGELTFPGEPEKTVVLVGDIIDKGPDSKKVIDFVHQNMKKGVVHTLIGNHENFVVKSLKGELSDTGLSKDFIGSMFDQALELEDDEDAKNKLLEVFERSAPFYFNENVIITHAPVSNDKLGKNTVFCYKQHYKLQYPRRADYNSEQEYVDAFSKQLVDPIMKEAEKSFPTHVFGHIGTIDISSYKNKVNIDSACYAGGKLTSITVNPYGMNYVQKVPSKQERKGEIDKSFFTIKPEKKIDLNELEGRDRGRVFALAENKVNFISGTMCPSDKDEENNDIESLDKALRYYKNKGESKVIMQPKYMGSRCNVYLHKEKEKSYAVTRRGFIINFIDVSPVFEQLYEKDRIKQLFEEKGAEVVIIDAELMPWKALGEGLIDKDFVTLERAVSSEVDLLKENGFEEELAKLRKECEDSGFKDKSEEMSKKKLSKEFGSHRTKVLSAFMDYDKKFVPLDEREKGVETFKEQLNIFAADDDLHIKPFSLLKTVYENGEEETYFDRTNEEVFCMVSDDDYEIIDLTDMEDAYNKASQFYNDLVKNEKMEGVVIKPNMVYVPDIAPYIKVRNKDYLTIVYGYDYKFDNKYQKLIKRKKINGKLNASIKEFEIGKRLLEIPYKDIHKENEEYKQLVAKMITEEKQEEELDPRL